VKHHAHADAEQRIAAAMAESTYFVKKEEVLDLPPKTHTPIYLEMTDEQQKYYNQIKNEAITYIQDATVTVEQASARMMKLLQICQGFALTDTVNDAGDRQGRHFTDAKTEALLDLLTDTLANRKVIVWAYFTYEIKRLTDVLTERGIPFVMIDGTVKSQRDRDAAMHRWNNDPTLRVYVRQLAMSEGVTLLGDDQVPCFDTIYMGLSYRLVDWKQSQDRIHRIGQRYACNYTYLLTDSGLDRRVYDSVLDKSEVASRVQQMGKDHFLALLKAS
jgi:ATP-dependent helicase STH1/SNF2